MANPTRAGLLGPAGKYGRIDKKEPVKPGAHPIIHWDRDTDGSDELFELTKPDGKWTIRHVNADVIMNGAPKWECGTDLNRQFETRNPDQRGHDESWSIYNMPDGRIVAYVEHETADGRKYTSAPLVIVEQK